MLLVLVLTDKQNLQLKEQLRGKTELELEHKELELEYKVATIPDLTTSPRRPLPSLTPHPWIPP